MFHSFSSRTVMFFCILSFSLIHLCGCHAAPSETTAAVQTTEEAEDALTISSDDNIYYLSVASSSDILLPENSSIPRVPSSALPGFSVSESLLCCLQVPA